MNTNLPKSPRNIAEPSQVVTGEVLRGMREAVGLTLRSMAPSVGCSFAHLARIESGQRRLTVDIGRGISRTIADQLTAATV